MNGEQLAALLAEKEIGVVREPLVLLTLGKSDATEEGAEQ